MGIDCTIRDILIQRWSYFRGSDCDRKEEWFKGDRSIPLRIFDFFFFFFLDFLFMDVFAWCCYHCPGVCGCGHIGASGGMGPYLDWNQAAV